MNRDEFQNINWEDPGSWPGAIKFAAALGLIGILFGAAWYFFLSDEKALYDTAQAEENNLKQQFDRKQRKAASLEAYREQNRQIEEMLRDMYRQLPGKTEIPNLLQDVSQTAIATGIEIERFEPQPENQKDYVAEKPIQLRMTGDYHEFGNFVSGVASLDRVVILTMHDISLKPVEPFSSELVLEGTVKTYRYLEDSEISEAAGPQGGAQ